MLFCSEKRDIARVLLFLVKLQTYLSTIPNKEARVYANKACNSTVYRVEDSGGKVLSFSKVPSSNMLYGKLFSLFQAFFPL